MKFCSKCSKNLSFEKKVTGLDIAEKISKSLAKQAMIIGVNGELKGLDFIIDKDCEVKIFTSKNKEGLEIIRHDTAHIMAMAVQELFPGTQVTIGPVIENGFYYDFARKEPFTEDDLNKIEVKMKEIVDRDEITKREVWDRDKAIKHFKKKGEIYKAELIESIPKEEEVSIYFHGEWHDLCRGPHLSSTGKIGKFFKLTKVSGAYWRGDSNNEMLQRHDLNPLEEAQGYKRLIDEFSYDQEKVSKFIGKSRSYITNSLRLLNLPSEVLKYVEDKKITAGHAKILVGLENASFVANKIIEKKLSVRQAENFVKIFKNKKNTLRTSKDTNIIALELSISNKIGLNVDIQNNKRNKGKISFEYKDLEQLNKIIDIIKTNY